MAWEQSFTHMAFGTWNFIKGILFSFIFGVTAVYYCYDDAATHFLIKTLDHEHFFIGVDFSLHLTVVVVVGGKVNETFTAVNLFIFIKARVLVTLKGNFYLCWSLGNVSLTNEKKT